VWTIWLRQHPGLKAPHFVGEGRRVFRGPTTDRPPHRGIYQEPFSIIDVFVTRQPAEDGLSHPRDH